MRFQIRPELLQEEKYPWSISARGGSGFTFQLDSSRVLRSSLSLNSPRNSASGTSPVVRWVLMIALILTGHARLAEAADECGAEAPGADTISCPAGTYSAGISYSNSDGLTLVLDNPGIDTTTRGVSVVSDGTTNETVSVVGTNFGSISAAAGSGILARSTGGGADAVAEMSAGAMTTTGRRGHALNADNAGGTTGDAIARLHGGTIETFGFNAVGIQARTFGSGNTIVEMTGGSIVTNNRAAYGFDSFQRGTGDASINMSGGSVVTNGLSSRGIKTGTNSNGNVLLQMSGDASVTKHGGNGAYGLEVRSNSSTSTSPITIQMDGGTVTTTGDNLSHGAHLIHRGFGTATLQMSNGSISTTGTSSNGVHAQTNGKIVVHLGDGSVSTGGTESDGVNAVTQDDIDIQLGGGSISTTGTDSTGVYAETQSDIAVEMGSGSISTAEANSVGVYAEAQGDIDMQLNDGAISTLGTDSIGAYAETLGAIAVQLGNGSISTAGANSDGLHAETQGDIDMQLNGGSVSAAGADSNGIYAETQGDISLTLNSNLMGGSGNAYSIYTSTAADKQVTIVLDSASNVSAASGLALFNNESNSDTRVNRGAVVAGSFSLNDGEDLLAFTGTDFSGITGLDGGDDVSAADGWVDTLTLTVVTATLDGSTVNNWETISLNGGGLTFSNGALTTGSETGVGLYLNSGAILNAGGGFALTGNMYNSGALSAQDGNAGDVIAVSGSYVGSGALNLDIDFSTDTADILQVQGDVSGSTTQIAVDDVSLGEATGNDIVVVEVAGGTDAGDFELAGGLVSSGAYSYLLGLTGSNWTLSSFSRIDASLYNAAPMAVASFSRLPTFEQRVSSRFRFVPGGSEDDQVSQSAIRISPVPASAEEQIGLWARVVGDRSQTTLSGTNTFGHTSTIGYLQFGADFGLPHGRLGQWVLGANAKIGQLDSSIETAFGDGSFDADGYGAGLSATWYSVSNEYIDIQLQADKLTGDFTSSSSGSLASDIDTRTLSASVEIGKRIPISDRVALIPQAQIWAGRSDIDDFMDNQDVPVVPGIYDFAVGRVGMAYEFTDQSAAGDKNRKAYLIGNLLREFSEDGAVRVMGVNHAATVENRTWAEIGLGESLQWDQSTQIYAEGAYRAALGGSASDNYGVSVNAGLRLNW